MKRFALYLTLIILFASNSATSQVLSDDELYSNAYSNLQNFNWVSASQNLFAYLQRNPVSLVKDKDRAKAIRDAYIATNQNIETEKTQMQSEIDNLQKFKDETIRNGNGAASGNHGLSMPPIPALPPPAEQNPRALYQRNYGVSLEGEWDVALTSASGGMFNGELVTTQQTSVISGEINFTDFPDASVTGIIDGQQVILLRNTGAETIQVYYLTKNGDDQFTGRYKNEGNSPDEGTVVLNRKTLQMRRNQFQR